MEEKEFSSVDVSDSGDHGLVQQHGADGCALGLQALYESVGSGASGQRVGPEPVGDVVDLCWAHDSTVLGSREVPGAVFAGQVKPDGVARESGVGPAAKLAYEAEVDVQRVVGEVDEQVLAPSSNVLTYLAVQLGRSLGEAALRGPDNDGPGAQVTGEVACEAMDGVTFWHLDCLAGPEAFRVRLVAGRRLFAGRSPRIGCGHGPRCPRNVGRLLDG